MYESETFGFAIARPLREVYEFLLEPTNFSRWAFVGDQKMRHLGGREWSVETSVGPRILGFAARNRFGILDHTARTAEGALPHPTGMWVVENGAGTELVYTNFRRPGMGEVEWASLKTWLVTDLLALQSLLEARGTTAPLMAAKVVSHSIARPLHEVYAYLAEPTNFGSWAFAGDAAMRPLGAGEWAVETSVGPRIIRFAGRNDFGVLTYFSRLDAGSPPHPVPMRVLPNGAGTELIYVFYQRPGSSDADFRSVVEWVTADLLALKSLLELG